MRNTDALTGGQTADIAVDGTPDAAVGASRDPVVASVATLLPGRIDPELVAAASRAWSANSKRAFLADLTVWRDWCRRVGVAVEDASPQVVVAFLRQCSQPWLLDARGQVRIHPDGSRMKNPDLRAVATLARYLVNIATAYRWAGLPIPTQAELVRLEMKALRRARGTAQKQAHPLRFKGDVQDLVHDLPSGICIARLLSAPHRDWTGRVDWLGLRDRAMLLVAYDTALRASELVAIEVEHIDGPAQDGSGLLFVPRSKTDQEGEGRHAYLSRKTMEAIAAWRTAAKFSTGPLFRSIRFHPDGSPREVMRKAVRADSVPTIYRRIVRQAWEQGALPDVSEAQLEKLLPAIRGHSTRVGVAQDNFAAGEDLPAIMQAYGWKDTRTVLRYGKKLAARSGAASRLAAKVWGDD